MAVTYTKITDLTTASALADGDLLEMVDVSDTTDNPSGSSFSVKLSQIKTYVATTLDDLTPQTTKGDLIGYSTTVTRVPVGPNGTVLTADSTKAAGLTWSTAGSGNMSTATYDPAGVAEQLVGLTAIQTLTNKTINASNNTLSNIDLTSAVTGVLPVANGGTSASTAAGARTNLDVEQTISGRALTGATVAVDDKVLIQDTNDSNNLKTVTTQAVADLYNTTATDAQQGIVELANAGETTTGTDATRAITPDGLAGSNFGRRILGINLVEKGTAVTTGFGNNGIPITQALDGYEVKSVQANVSTAGVTGQTDIQLIKQRSTTFTNVLTTATSITTGEFSSNGVVQTDGTEDLATGDMLYVTVTSVHSGTAPQGLSVAIEVGLP